MRVLVKLFNFILVQCFITNFTDGFSSSPALNIGRVLDKKRIRHLTTGSYVVNVHKERTLLSLSQLRGAERGDDNDNYNDNYIGEELRSNQNEKYDPIYIQNDCDTTNTNIISRRTAVQSIVSLASLASVTNILTSSSQPATAIGDSLLKEQQEIPNLKCLLDLPPIPTGCVRLYLCRHGQTEYNRLKQIQGARIDAPLNETGMKQATRLGKALSHLGDTNESYVLTAGAHSNMLRARQTASIAATTLESITEKKKIIMINNNDDKNNNDNNNGLQRELINDSLLGSDDETVTFVSNKLTEDSTNPTIQNGNAPLRLQLQSLSSLGEVDFGPLNEGKPSALAKADMYGTYGAWSLGRIDTTLGGGGESGREVLTRAASALNSLVDVAAGSGSGSAIAVSHSTYLRMLLALAMDIPLTDAAALEQKNCCINVLDVSVKGRRNVGPKSNLFGMSPGAPQDFGLNIPLVNVVRVNEIQHLSGLI